MSEHVPIPADRYAKYEANARQVVDKAGSFVLRPATQVLIRQVVSAAIHANRQDVRAAKSSVADVTEKDLKKPLIAAQAEAYLADIEHDVQKTADTWARTGYIDRPSFAEKLSRMTPAQREEYEKEARQNGADNYDHSDRMGRIREVLGGEPLPDFEGKPEPMPAVEAELWKIAQDQHTNLNK
jgi:hypothetical protein